MNLDFSGYENAIQTVLPLIFSFWGVVIVLTLAGAVVTLLIRIFSK